MKSYLFWMSLTETTFQEFFFEGGSSFQTLSKGSSTVGHVKTYLMDSWNFPSGVSGLNQRQLYASFVF